MSYYLIAAFVFGVVTSLIAYSKGRNSLGWFVAGMIIGPFALVVAALPPVGTGGDFATCPACFEVIQGDARICRFCGTERVQPRDNAAATPEKQAS